MEKSDKPPIIKTVSSAQAVRHRPSMYFGKCIESKSLDILPMEVACHAIDEIIDGKCTTLKIFVHKEYFSIQYDAGMSLKVLKNSDGLTETEIIMTQIMACSNLKKHLEVGEDLCRIGMAAINFASEWCEVETVSNNKSAIFKFSQGQTISKQIRDSDGTDRTVIRLKPDKSIFGNLLFSFNGIVSEAQKLSAKLNGFAIDVEEI